jgi:hypothetical protein
LLRRKVNIYISRNTDIKEHKMLIQAIVGWAKSLTDSFNKPQTYGSALEAYIVRNQPQDACDVDRLTREFENRMSGRSCGGFPC